MRSAAALSAPGPSLHRVGGIGPRRLGHCHGYSTILAAPLLLVPIVHVALGPVLRSSMLRAPWKTARAAQAGSVESSPPSCRAAPLSNPRAASETNYGLCRRHHGGTKGESLCDRKAPRDHHRGGSGCPNRDVPHATWRTRLSTFAGQFPGQAKRTPRRPPHLA